MKFTKSFILLMLYSALTSLHAQQLTQIIRGTVTDKVTGMPLPGANVIVINSDPFLGAATGINGTFKITGVALGNQTLKITFLGYKELQVPNVVVNSGKEVVLNINLEEAYIQGSEVVITGNKDKSKTINEMSTVSARTFSVEETRKYAAAVNDPARMASSFAGVISTDDGNNHISIRGNSPNGLLWRMEGVEIPNPNHFAIPGSSGGGISILSAQVMSNSDFMTGAFAAEYGNALSGVFDIRLRKGNNERPEYTIQAGFLGLDAAAEGPFKKGYNGSYLVNYRFSTLSVLSKMGVNVGDGITNFQDLSYNIFLPTNKYGNFSLFGFGGLSSQEFKSDKDSLSWESESERYSSDFNANTGATGITHSLILGNDTWIKSAVVVSGVGLNYHETRVENDYSEKQMHSEISNQDKITFTSTLSHKFSARHNIRAGAIINRIGYKVDQHMYDQDVDALEHTINNTGNTYTTQLFIQSKYNLTEKLALYSGLHSFMLTYNSTWSIEPRASLKYEIDNRQSVSVGYGLHSQLQPVGTYFATLSDGSHPNESLGFSKSHHLVGAYDRQLNETLRFKSEVYYQHLFDIPVRSDIENSFSMINVSDGYGTDPLENKGTGTNYGLELTLEQFLKKDYYFLFSGSLYDSKYKGSDGVERNSRYNGGYGLSFTAGREISTGTRFKKRVIGLNIKTIYRGGFRDTPIDLEASAALPGQGAVYMEDQAFSIKYPAYFRTDIRVSVKRNRLHSTQTLALDIQNVSNHKNIYGKFYNEESNSLKTYYQTPLIPVLSYRIEF